MVTRYDDVRRVLSDYEVFSAKPVADIDEAMAAFSESFGLTWGRAELQAVLAFVPGEEPAEQQARTTFSRQGARSTSSSASS